MILNDKEKNQSLMQIVRIWFLNQKPIFLTFLALILFSFPFFYHNGGQNFLIIDSKLFSHIQTYSHKNWVYSVQFSPDQKMFASSSSDKNINIYDAYTNMQIAQLQGHSACVYSIQFFHNSNRLISASMDKSIKIWVIKNMISKDLNSMKLLYSLDEAHDHEIFSISLSNDDQTLISGGKDKVLKVWLIKDFIINLKRQIDEHSHYVTYVKFSPDNKVFITVSKDKYLKVWDSRSFNILSEFENIQNHEVWVSQQISFSKDDQYISVAGPLNNITIIERKYLKIHRVLQSNHTSHQYSLVYSYDGKELASANKDGSINIWDLELGQQTQLLQGHPSWISSLDYSLNGKKLISGSYDNTLRLWERSN